MIPKHSTKRSTLRNITQVLPQEILILILSRLGAFDISRALCIASICSDSGGSMAGGRNSTMAALDDRFTIATIRLLETAVRSP